MEWFVYVRDAHRKLIVKSGFQTRAEAVALANALLANPANRRMSSMEILHRKSLNQISREWVVQA